MKSNIWVTFLKINKEIWSNELKIVSRIDDKLKAKYNTRYILKDGKKLDLETSIRAAFDKYYEN